MLTEDNGPAVDGIDLVLALERLGRSELTEAFVRLFGKEVEDIDAIGPRTSDVRGCASPGFNRGEFPLQS